MIDTLTMPPAGLQDDTDEQRRLRMAGMPPAGSVVPPATPSGTSGLSPSTMPPVSLSTPQQPANAAVGTSGMPPAQSPQPVAAPQANAMPAAPMGPPAPTQTPEPKLEGWKKYLNSIGSIFPIGRAIESGIPGTPQNWEMQQGKEAGREAQAAETAQKTGAAAESQGRAKLTEEQAKQLGNMVPVTLPNGQTIYLNEKDAAGILGKQVQGSTATTVQGMKGTTAENIQGEKGTTAETIQGEKGKTAEGIAAGKNTTAEDIAKMRTESAANIAKGHDLTTTEAARIRAASADDPNKLTSTMKTMKQQAQSTLPQIDKAIDETEKVANLLGPGEGRWNDFWQGKIGVSDPAYAHYKDEIAFVSTAVTLAHARGRMSSELFDHFQKMFDTGKQSPENLIAALNVAHEWLDGYAKMGETPATAPSASTVPTSPKEGPPAAQPGMKVQSRTVNGKTEYRQVPIGQ